MYLLWVWFWMTLAVCMCAHVGVFASLHARGPTVCVFACHASVSAVHKHEHNVLQYVWAGAGTIADCLVCFLFFFPLPFSCPRFDYNQVFFLILQWAKEQRTVQRASQWAALCWTVSNTWGSDQLVSPPHLAHSSLFPPIMPAIPVSSVTLSYHRAVQHQSSCV